MIQIYHNSRCGKSRNCVTLLENSKKESKVIHYLLTPPTFDELSLIVKKLNIEPIDLVRVNEKVWIDSFKNLKMNNQQLIQAMVAHPILIERTIVSIDDKAIIGRDLEKVKAFIS